MKSSPTLKELATALTAAQPEMPVIGFDATNPFLKNKYASLGAVVSATRPVLAKHGLAILQLPVSNVGVIQKTEPMDEQKPDGPRAHSERQGTIDIGVETVLLHSSGEWMSETLFIPLSKEKGKSQAQVSGSIISYLRRYAWASILGLYADEDTDGNDAPSRFDDLPTERRGVSTPQPSPKSSPQPKPAASTPPSAPPDNSMVGKMKAKLGPVLPEFVRCLQNRPADSEGRVVLTDGKGLEAIPDAWAKYFLDNWDSELAKVDLWCQQNPKDTAAGPPSSVQVPRDENIDPHSPDAPWRAFPMPWGEKKGTPLEKLDKKYLFGLWANYTVETTYQGKPKKQETIAADTKFRAMLDEAGKHYEFHK